MNSRKKEMKWQTTLPWTGVVHGLWRHIVIGFIESKRFVHNRIAWCANSCKGMNALTAWNMQNPCRICDKGESSVETRAILEALKGDMFVSELDMKLAEREPSEHAFHFEQVQDDWEEIEQQSVDI